MTNYPVTDPFQNETNTSLEDEVRNIGKLYPSLPNVRDMREGKLGFYFEGANLFCIIKIRGQRFRVGLTPI